MDAIALLLAATLNAGTVLAIAGLGLLINERAGIVNLGVEGMMLVAALAGFATGVHTGSDVLGFCAGAVTGALMAAAFGVLVIWLNTNQYATGLALSLFYIGGELAQSRMGLPKSLTGVFQGLLLFSLLASDTLIHYRLRWQARHPAPPPSAPAPAAPLAATGGAD